ncbi:MAG: hypothetical protein JWM31_1455, partial [Solirubrobacterales bacterium]|nr:hypothetical protein [Solirubrobacterales bacterium]
MRTDEANSRHRTSIRAATAGALAWVLACLVLVPSQARAADRSCGWAVQATANQANVAYPDEAAKYWIAAVPLAPGSHLELAGHYPHARYLSFITYTPQTQAIDGINDQQIIP